VLLVALTGGIGSGKSTVAELLGQRGAHVVDADAVARWVVEPGQPALASVAERFGPGVIRADGTLDRPALADLAFADDDSRRALEAITHPAIVVEMDRLIAASPPDAVVVVEIQLLVETMQGAVLIPVSAVQRGAPGTFVYVVKEDSTVAATPVTLGPGQGVRVAVTKGLEAGQVIVTDGADRLKDGAKVTLAGGGNRQNAGGDATPANPAPAAAPTAEKAQPHQRGQGQGRRRSSE